MVDVEVVSRKLGALRGYVDSLEAATDITWERYRDEERTRAFVERYLHLATEAVIDLANHVVSLEDWREPTGYRDLFAVLAENGVIPPPVLPQFQDMASFRNLLVHRYDTIDAATVYGVFRKRLGDFRQFYSLVKAWTEAKVSHAP